MTPALRDLLVGESPAMAAVRDQVDAAMEHDAPVLLEGERGTGRERVARVLHEIGPRSARRFVRLDRAKVERDLEKAAGGTLLVKDIARVGAGAQRRVLKVLRGRSRDGSDVRVIAATTIDLTRAVADQLFDAELFERLGPVKIALPPLRRRPEDVPPLAGRFVREAAEEQGRARLHLKPRAVDRLVAYPWPGNVGELRDVVSRVAFRSRRSNIELDDVEAELPKLEDRVPLEELSFEEMVRAKIRHLLDQMEGYPVEDLYQMVIARVERPLIELVMAQSGGSQVRAAKILGLNRNTLRKKLAQVKKK